MLRFRCTTFLGLGLLVTGVDLQDQLQQALQGLSGAANCTGKPQGFSVPANEGCASPSGVCAGDFEWQEWVTAHNLYRCMHAIPPISWSSEIYRRASWEFYNNPSLHRTKSYKLEPPAGPAGENIAQSTTATTPFKYVSSWYAQIANCAGFPGCAPNPGTNTNSFTKMIWQGAKEMGCYRNQNHVAVCWYKGSDTPSCETPNFGREDVEYKGNVFAARWSFDYCVQGFKAAGIPVPDVSGVDSVTGLSLETPGLFFEDASASAFTGNAFIALVVAGVSGVSMVIVAVVRRRRSGVRQLEEIADE